MALYRNISVPVPPEAQAVSSTGRVYIIREKIYDQEAQSNKDKRLTIGKLNSTDGSTMNPNDNYASRYPTQFLKASREKSAPGSRRMGMYVLSLACSTLCGLYPTLVESCGAEFANFIMDYAMYSIQYKTNAAVGFEPLMHDQLLFSSKVRSDSWISDFFAHKLDSSFIDSFRESWVRTCTNKGMKKVWLCIDGSNNDCACQECSLAEKGHAKSLKNTNIYSYMYAVSAEDGTPVAYDIYRGGQLDRKAFLKMAAMLKAYGLEAEGVILDRGFCDTQLFKTVLSLGYKYVIMMKENLYGFTSQLESYGKEICNNARFLAGPGIFAAVHKGLVFKDFDQESFITLAYDAASAGERIRHFTRKVYTEIQKCRQQIEKYGTAEVSPDYRKYIGLTEDGRQIVTTEAFQKEIDRKGFSALACSEDFDAGKVMDLYDLRDCSEKQYMILKSQLGFHAGRSHQDQGIEARHFAGFIAGILRNEISKKCKEAGYPLSKALRELNFLEIFRIPDNTYMAGQNASTRQIELLKTVGLSLEDLDFFAGQESIRVNGEVWNQAAQMPERYSQEEDTGSIPVKKGRGRPKGSRNRPKGLKVDTVQKEPKRRGRPPGSKNRPKSERVSGTD